MPDAIRVVDRIQDQSDFDSSWNPAASNGYVMVWNTGSSLWVPSSVSASPGGSSGQLQYNNSGSFAGTAALTYSLTTQHLLITNQSDIISQKIVLYNGQTVDAFQATIYDATSVVTKVTKDGYVYSLQSDGTQYVGLRGTGSSPSYPGLHCHHDNRDGYFTYGYQSWDLAITTTTVWSASTSFVINLTPASRLGTDANVTTHSIYRATSYVNAAKGAGIKIYADAGPTGATNSDGGDIWIYGGALRGTGINGDVHLGFDGTTRLGTTKIYKPVYPSVSPTNLTANVNNYAPTAGRFQRWSTDGGNYTVTGLSLSQVDGMEITIINLGSGTITISDEDASSTAANRFLCVSGASITLDPNERTDLIYDGTTQRWRAF